MSSFPLSVDTMSRTNHEAVGELAGTLMQDLIGNARRKSARYRHTGNVEYDEFFLSASKATIDEIDRVLAEHYGFTEEELDFIINYDIK